MRVLLTGSTGVMGRRVIPLLRAAGHDVTAVARSAEKRAALERAGAAAVMVDLYDPVQVLAAVRGHDAVINLATHIPPPARAFLPGAWSENSRVRREVSRNLADAVIQRRVPRMIQESFAPIYPHSGDEWIDETQPTKPASYNQAVIAAEAAAERVTRSGGAGVVLRFAYFYGPDSEFTRALIESVRKGRAHLLGDPRGFWSSVSHDDAASAVAAALGVPVPKLLPGWLKYLLGSLGETLARSERISNRKFKAASGWAPRSRSVVEGAPQFVSTL